MFNNNEHDAIIIGLRSCEKVEIYYSRYFVHDIIIYYNNRNTRNAMAVCALCCSHRGRDAKNHCTIIAQVSNYAYVCAQLPRCVIYDELVQYYYFYYATIPRALLPAYRKLDRSIWKSRDFIVYLSVRRVLLLLLFFLLLNCY